MSRMADPDDTDTESDDVPVVREYTGHATVGGAAGNTPQADATD